MLFSRPHFKEYVMARLVTLVVSIFALTSLALISLASENNMDYAYIAIALLGFSFIIFLYFIYRSARQMQNELTIINNYLANLNKIDKIEHQTHFFISEFEAINQNLTRVLKSAKKREDVKQRYAAKLKLKNRQRADMISAIAHEFRNPIASIMGYSQTLQEDPDIPKELQEKFLKKIHNNGNKIEALLSRLILWNSFESGEASLELRDFDVYTLVTDIKKELEDKYVNRNIFVEGYALEVRADLTLLELVLKNIIENALKYSQDDVWIKLEDRRISVLDKGVGIASCDIEKVSKKFYRAGTDTWDNSMGLGLSIVKNILTLHQTKLEIQSEEGKGSTFSFLL